MIRNQFEWVHRSQSAIEAAVVRALQHKRGALDAVIAITPDERTFANTIAALEYADDDIADLQQQLSLLLSVHPDETIRTAAQAGSDRIDAENVEMEYDRRLWTAVQAWTERGEQLNAIDQKLADERVRDMRRMGFALPEEQFTALKGNITELQKLQTAFEKAINDWEDHIVVSREQLAGLPERYINGLTREGDRFHVSLEYPDFFPFMRTADDDTARRELATKNLLKGGRENLERLARMIMLRQENAKLLGYTTHADYVTEPRMARTGRAAIDFIERILTRLQPAARRELQELVDIKRRSLRSAEHPTVGFHEFAYWDYKLLKERYDIDSELVKEYFPLQRVIEGMLSIYQEVLGISFRRVTDAALWHADAQLYEVIGGETSYGHFILDLYPRKGKYGHAAAFPITLSSVRSDGVTAPGLVALVCNFPKETKEEPSLLAIDEVETLLHEFGHVMHALLSCGKWQRQNGFGVAMDFIEAMSQMFEEWAWDSRVMDRIGGHYRTGAAMPDELKQKVIAARHHMDASSYLQQATKALYDLRIHSQPTEMPVDGQFLADSYRTIKMECEQVALPPESLFPAGWGHMADYDAGYYGYLWSKVYALDMYSKFGGNPLNLEVGARYRREILEPGASREELDLIRAFLERAPSDAPFLKALGISGDIDPRQE